MVASSALRSVAVRKLLIGDRVTRSARSVGHSAGALAEMAASSTPDRARRYLIRALSLAEWTVALDALAETDPAVLDEIADDFLAEG